MSASPNPRLVSVPNIEYFHKNEKKSLENKTAKQNIQMKYSVHLILGILDQGQVTKYFCGFFFFFGGGGGGFMYIVFYNYSNAGPECRASPKPWT